MIPFILPVDTHNNIGGMQENYDEWKKKKKASLFQHQALRQETEEFCLWNLSAPGERTKDISNMGFPTNFQLQFTVNKLYICSQSF